MKIRSKRGYLKFSLLLLLAIPGQVFAQTESTPGTEAVTTEPSPITNFEEIDATPNSPSGATPASDLFVRGESTPIDQIRNRELLLVRNVPRTIEFDYDIGEIATGNPNIATPILDRPRRRMIISPLSPGTTAILVFDSRGIQRDKIDVVVTSSDLDQYVKDLKFILRDIEGVTFTRVGSRIMVEGEVYLQSDLERINDIVRDNTFVVNLVRVSQDTQRILSRRIKNEINISGVEVDTIRDRIVLKGEVAQEQEKERAEKIAGIYVKPESIVNVIAVNPDRKGSRPSRLVQITAHFVELNKSFMRNFNFSWAPSAFGDMTITPGTADPFNFTAVISNFIPRLATAKALGVARVFHNPSVSVKSGEAAAIRSGASLILQSIDDEGKVVSSGEPVQIGLDLNVTPTADDRDFVDMKVGVSVKSLGSATTEVQGVLVNESSVQTSNYVRSGETVALGGVVKSSFVDVKDAPQPFAFQPPGSQESFTPALGNIFHLFKSRAINQDRSIFIVFVTPEILVSARDASKELRQKMNVESVEPVAADEKLEGN